MYVCVLTKFVPLDPLCLLNVSLFQTLSVQL